MTAHDHFSVPNPTVLHVISAGNFPGIFATSRNVTAPAPAKNAITVGAMETYNQVTAPGYDPGCAGNNLDNADNPRQVTSFSRTGFPNLRLKPDVVAPGTRSYGRRSASLNVGCGATNCNLDLGGLNQYGWSLGTSFAAPAVSGVAAIVREWLAGLGQANPSPALVKATLIATARNLAPCTNLPACTACTTCAYCGDMRPIPDKYQGWGGASLDRFFRAAGNYFFYDQLTTFTVNGQQWMRTLNITDTSQPVNIAVVWTDRASADTPDTNLNLINDLDLQVQYTDGTGTHTWVGNYYHTDVDSCARDGFSLRDPSPIVIDHKNNVERVTINPAHLTPGITAVTVTVTAFSLTGDGIDPRTNDVFRQDFAVMGDNVHE